MKVTNNASFPVIAFGIVIKIGYGDDVMIPPGKSADISGPYVGKMGGGSCHIHMEGELTCHENPDDDNGFQIAKGEPICLQIDDGKKINIRHFEDPVEDYVMAWRDCNSLNRSSTANCVECKAVLCADHIFNCKRCGKPMCHSCYVKNGNDFCSKCSPQI